MASDGAGSLPAVLVTNDDGIDAPGIRLLVAVLAASGVCRVYVCAPDKERSAVGHGITLRETLEANLEDMPGATLAYSLTGTPADCASVGISGQLFPKPDLVLSGINKGSNAGLSIIYSGTVAGAREAHLSGVPAISLSLDWNGQSRDDFFESAAQECMPLIKASIDAAVDGTFSKDFFFNVNVPAVPKENKGFKLVTQGMTNINFSWMPVDRRSGYQVASGRSAGISAPPAAHALPGMNPNSPLPHPGLRPVPLPGMAGAAAPVPLSGRGGPVALPGMARGGPIALPGMGRGGSGPALSLADLGAAAAAKGAKKMPESDGPAAEEPSGPKHRIHFRHEVGPWDSKDVSPDVDIMALGHGFITVTPLALLTSAPGLHSIPEQAHWMVELFNQ